MMTIENFNLIESHIRNIKIGDSILFDGVLKTVGRNNIKFCPLMGKTIFGDSFNLGYKKVLKVGVK